MSVPQFNTLNFSAPDRYIGAGSGMIPCAAGDTITFTASIQFISGPMQPMISVVFLDSTQLVILGFIQISPPNTDTGWHNYTFTALAPAGAQFMAIQTQCEYLNPPGGGVIDAQTTEQVLGQFGSPTTIPVNNTNFMEVGISVNVHVPRGFGVSPRNFTTQILGVVSGVSFTAYVPGLIFVGSTITGGLPPGLCYFVGYVPQGYVPPSTGAGQTTWATSNFRLTQNGNPVFSSISTFSTVPNFTYSVGQSFVFPLYYLSLITSEFQSAPNLYAWLTTLLTPLVDMLAFTPQLYQAYNLQNAVGPQLDAIGGIVGANRILPFQPVSGQIQQASPSNLETGYVVGDILGVTQAGASAGTVQVESLDGSGNVLTLAVVDQGTGYTSASGLATTGGSGTGLTVTIEASGTYSSTLDDSDYRTLIQAKIAQNQWDGSIAQIYALWNSLYPGSAMTFIDNQNMTCTIILSTGSLSSLQLQMIENGLILPRPQGVLYTYTTALEPIFGADLSNAVIAGADLGHAS